MATEKARTLRGLSQEDLKVKEVGIREELFNLRFQKKVGQIENPLKLRTLRKDLARLLTVAKEADKKKSQKSVEVK